MCVSIALGALSQAQMDHNPHVGTTQWSDVLSFLSCTAPGEYVVVLKNMFVSRLCFLCPPSSLAYEGAYCIFWNCFSLAKAADTPRFSAKLTDVLCSPSRPHLTTIVGVSSPCHHLLTHQSCLFVFVHHFLTNKAAKCTKRVSFRHFCCCFFSGCKFFPFPWQAFPEGVWGFLEAARHFRLNADWESPTKHSWAKV